MQSLPFQDVYTPTCNIYPLHNQIKNQARSYYIRPNPPTKTALKEHVFYSFLLISQNRTGTGYHLHSPNCTFCLWLQEHL
jgi:hypothetical protein